MPERVQFMVRKSFIDGDDALAQIAALEATASSAEKRVIGMQGM